MAAFETELTVRFAHVDAAGIVFYPRYFEMLNQVVEEWFEGPLARPWRAMHLAERRGVPLVEIRTRFHRPSRLGDRLRFRLHVTRLGRSALDLALAAACAGEERLSAELTLVWTNLERMKAARLPEDLAARIRPFLAVPAETSP